MAKIIAPNKEYNGVSAGVRFCNGQAECSDKWTIDWFKEHGYKVEEAASQPQPVAPEPVRDRGGKENTNNTPGTANDEKVHKPDNAEHSGGTKEEIQNEGKEEKPSSVGVRRKAKK